MQAQQQSNVKDKEEKILQEDNERTPSLFPIKYPELYNYYKIQRDSFWAPTEINISQDIQDWQKKLSEEQRRFIEKVLAFFASADALVNMNLVRNLYQQIKIPEAQHYYLMQMAIEAIHCVGGETDILTDEGNKKIEDLRDKECQVWNGKEYSGVVVRYTGDQELIRVRLSNGISIQATKGHKWYVERDRTKYIKTTEELEPGSYIQQFDLPKEYREESQGDYQMIGEKERKLWDLWVSKNKDVNENPSVYMEQTYETMYGLSGYLRSIYENREKGFFEIEKNRIKYNQDYMNKTEEQKLYYQRILRQNNYGQVYHHTINISKNKNHQKIFTFENRDKESVYKLKMKIEEIIHDINMTQIIWEMMSLEVPYRKKYQTKIKWLHFFLLDHQKNYVYYNVNAETYVLVMENHKTRLLHEMQLLLETLGIKSWIQRVDNNIENKYALFMDEKNIIRLSGMYSEEFQYFGYKNISWTIAQRGPYCYGKDMKKLQKYLFTRDQINPGIKVMSKYRTVNKEYPTYCFSEKKEGKGTFNNIVTGQSETYSLLIEGLVRDQKRKTELFNGIKTIHSIKKKAEWYQKYTDDRNVPLGTRLLVQSYMEGVSFASSFCAIFWLKDRKMMNQLCTANEFISRDETLHQEFSNALYNNYVKHKIAEEEVHKIYKEATDIEEEFVNEALETDLIGMTKEKMIEYVRYMCNYQLRQLGLQPLYPGVKNPFKFMDQIGADIKANFFETRATAYHKYSQGIEDNKNENYENVDF